MSRPIKHPAPRPGPRLIDGHAMFPSAEAQIHQAQEKIRSNGPASPAALQSARRRMGSRTSAISPLQQMLIQQEEILLRLAAIEKYLFKHAQPEESAQDEGPEQTEESQPSAEPVNP